MASVHTRGARGGHTGGGGGCEGWRCSSGFPSLRGAQRTVQHSQLCQPSSRWYVTRISFILPVF